MVKTLKRSPVFQDLAPSELAEFASRIDSRFYPKGSFIFREGDPADSIHIVHDGLVRVLRHSRSGKKLIFAILAQGEIIATPGPSEKRLRVSSEAVTDVILFRVPKEEFLEYVAGRPKAAIGMIALLAKRFNRECDRSVDTLSEEVEIRLAALSPHSGEQVRHQAFPHAQGACGLCGDNHRDHYPGARQAQGKGAHSSFRKPGRDCHRGPRRASTICEGPRVAERPMKSRRSSRK